MARYYPNKNSYSKILDRKFTRKIFIWLFFLLGMGFAYWLTTSEGLVGAVIGYIIAGIVLYFVYEVFRDMGRNDRGEAAEFLIKKKLDELPYSYAVFQNVLIAEKLDADFIIIGPKGVIVIEVKSYGGFSGFKRRGFLNQAFREAINLKEILKNKGVNVYVNSVLVFTDKDVRYVPATKGVHVVGKDYLLSLIDRFAKITYDQVKVEFIVNSLHNQ